jgi:hypothetical protein
MRIMKKSRDHRSRCPMVIPVGHSIARALIFVVGKQQLKQHRPGIDQELFQGIIYHERAHERHMCFHPLLTIYLKVICNSSCNVRAGLSRPATRRTFYNRFVLRASCARWCTVAITMVLQCTDISPWSWSNRGHRSSEPQLARLYSLATA